MYINKILIKKFRGFENVNIELNKHITCISGHNGVGKSTILALLSNIGEVKEHRTLTGHVFRGEFEKIIIGNQDYDSVGDVCEIEFNDVIDNIPNLKNLTFRAAFQTRKAYLAYYKKLPSKIISNIKFINEEQKITLYYDKKKLKRDRYRLLPKKVPGLRDNEKKLNWPTIYLGLSRLYPMGEIEAKLDSKPLETNYGDVIMGKHKEIMSSSDDYRSISITPLENITQSTSFDTETYPHTSNSAGQGNLGQILSAVFSFKNLKDNNRDSYTGGILLIDELDATLHPAAQTKLLKFLLEQSVELNLQIVFTTHSMTLLEYINKNNNENISVKYLTKRIGNLEIVEDPSTAYLKNDLNSLLQPTNIYKTPVLAEDNVAREYFSKIIDYHNNLKLDSLIDRSKLRFIESNIGWSNVVQLIKYDYTYFKNYIILFDTDLNGNSLKPQLKSQLNGSPYKEDKDYFILPVHSRYKEYCIEKSIIEYLLSLPQDHVFYRTEFCETQPINKSMIIDSFEAIDDLEDNKKYKHWYNEYKYIIDEVYPFFLEDQKENILRFCSNIRKKIN